MASIPRRAVTARQELFLRERISHYICQEEGRARRIIFNVPIKTEDGFSIRLQHEATQMVPQHTDRLVLVFGHLFVSPFSGFKRLAVSGKSVLFEVQESTFYFRPVSQFVLDYRRPFFLGLLSPLCSLECSTPRSILLIPSTRRGTPRGNLCCLWRNI